MALFAHPPIQEVELSNGHTVRVRPWVMAQRAELRPKIIALMDRLAAREGGFQGALASDLVTLFIDVEDEVESIVRTTISREELPDEVWETMGWGDLPTLAQAIWDLNVTRPEGLLGKMGAGLGRMIATALAAAAEEQARAGQTQKAESPSPTAPSKTTLRPVDSPSSPGAATATPST